MKALTNGLCAALVGIGLVACDDKPKPPEEELPTLSTPLSLGSGLLYVPEGEVEDAEAVLLDLKSGRTKTEPLPEGKVHAYARSDHEGQALVLTEGTPAKLEEDAGVSDAVPSHVLIFDAEGAQKRFVLSARYSALSISGDGRYAIAYGPSGSWATSDNIAVLDLDAPGEEREVESTSVRALDGQGPSAIAFAPSDSERRLAVLVMTDAVNVIDLEHPELRDKVLPLKLPSTAAALRARKVLFAGDHCFVQPDRGNDVIAISFEDDSSQRGFHAALSTLGTESTLQDIALLDDSRNPRLLTVGEGSLRVIDTLSGAGESSVATKYTAAHVFEGKSPFDAESRTRALLYSNQDSRLGFVDLQPELPGTERSVDTLTLNGPVDKIAFPATGKLAIVTQSNGKVSIVDLEERTVSLLDAGSQVNRLVLDERPGVQLAWLLTSSGSLGTLDLAQRTPRELLLEKPGTFVIPVDVDGPRMAIGQGINGGDLLLLDATEPSRSTAREVDGFREIEDDGEG